MNQNGVLHGLLLPFSASTACVGASRSGRGAFARLMTTVEGCGRGERRPKGRSCGRLNEGLGGGREGGRASAAETKVPEGLRDSPSGGPKGSSNSHGTSTAYLFYEIFAKSEPVSTTAVPPQGLPTHLRVGPLEPTLLSRAGLPPPATPLAGREAAASSPAPSGEPPAACGGRTVPPPTPTGTATRHDCRKLPSSPRSRPGASSRAARVVTQ